MKRKEKVGLKEVLEQGLTYAGEAGVHCGFFAAGDILRDNFLHQLLLLLPPCPQFKYFPILNLQSPLPTGVAIMGHSMVETVSIILSAEEGGKGGRLEMPKATMPTNIEHWPGPYLLYLLTTPKISSLL